jgi:Lipid A 3-O-deacylase (PagL)
MATFFPVYRLLHGCLLRLSAINWLINQRPLTLAIAFCFLCAGLGAQPNGVNIYAHYGYIARHSDEVQHLATHHITIIQADAIFKSWLHPNWAYVWGKPQVGLTAMGVFTGDGPHLGNIAALGVFVEPVLIKGNRHIFTYRVCTGLGYNPVVFNKDDNRLNVLYSTPINCLMQGQLKYTFMLNPNLGLKAGVGITHFSNGAYKLPNQGINILSAHAGIGYFFKSTLATSKGHIGFTPDTVPGYQKNWKIQANLAFSLIDIEPSGGAKYPYYIATLLASKRTGVKSSFNVGAEFFYNTGLKDMVRMPDTSHFSGPFGRVGLVAGHEWHLSKISLLTQAGYYLYKKTPVDAPIYFRAGLRYYPRPNLYAGVYLKTHYASADCIEWVLGANIWNQNRKIARSPGP